MMAGPSRSALWRYGVLALPVAFAGFPLYVLAPDLYATRYGVALSALGAALVALRLFDAVQDPLIGMLSDHYRRFAPAFMMLAAGGLCAGISALFISETGPALLRFMLTMALAVTAYSVLSINLSALGALWGRGPADQTRIAMAREGFALVGLVLAVSLPGLLGFVLPESQVWYGFALTLLALMVLAMTVFLRWMRLHGEKAEEARAAFFIRPRDLSPGARFLLAVYGVSMVASAIPAVLVIFFVRDLLGAEAWTGLFLMLYFLSGAAFMPFWKWLSLTTGGDLAAAKAKAWAVSMLLASAVFIWALTLGEGDVLAYALICIASGAALGADMVFPPALLADELHHNRSGAHAAAHYALLTLIAKAALALASGIALPLLDLSGFTPDAENSAAALWGLSLAYALIPCLLKLAGLAGLWFFYLPQARSITHETPVSPPHSRPSDNGSSDHAF